ncbi:MAG: phytanoyl-CoA dioxygenase family protein [Prochlorococcaceae cyanobacterium]
MFSLLTRKKRFGDPWIGHPQLNRGFALHRRRMQLAEGLCRWRRWLVAPQGPALPLAALSALARDGCVQIPDFLPPAAFAALREEVEQAVVAAGRVRAPGRNHRPGYQRKRPFAGGFDRFDGGTLNRFLAIQPSSMPQAARVCADSRLTACSRTVIGLPHRPANMEIYLTVHGEEARTPDLQKVLHRDTFFRALKFWLFLRPVSPEDGPFVYVPGSHRLDRRRLEWEQARANVAIATRAMPNVGGSFRIHESDLGGLGLPGPLSFSCSENTLVVADVLGFHRRGDALPGRQRLALYGWLRPYPFLPVPW